RRSPRARRHARADTVEERAWARRHTARRLAREALHLVAGVCEWLSALAAVGRQIGTGWVDQPPRPRTIRRLPAAPHDAPPSATAAPGQRSPPAKCISHAFQAVGE